MLFSQNNLFGHLLGIFCLQQKLKILLLHLLDTRNKNWFQVHIQLKTLVWKVILVVLFVKNINCSEKTLNNHLEMSISQIWWYFYIPTWQEKFPQTDWSRSTTNQTNFWCHNFQVICLMVEAMDLWFAAHSFFWKFQWQIVGALQCWWHPAFLFVNVGFFNKQKCCKLFFFKKHEGSKIILIGSWFFGTDIQQN